MRGRPKKYDEQFIEEQKDAPEETADNSSFDSLPQDHPIHELARAIWEGAEKFDAFHAVRPDGTHLFVDIQRFVAPKELGNPPLRSHAKLQTGYIGAMPEIGRMSDWSARAAAFSDSDEEFQDNDGTHAKFIKRSNVARIRAAIAAENSPHKAGFAERIEGTPEEIKTPFPIEPNAMRKRYLKEK